MILSLAIRFINNYNDFGHDIFDSLQIGQNKQRIECPVMEKSLK